jgi:hypothetical protein
MTHPAPTGIQRRHFGELLEELAPRWELARESALEALRGGPRKRAEGAGRKPKLVFVDRLLATLVQLRLGLPHEAPAELYCVDRSTVSSAVRQVRALLADRGFAVPDRPGARIRTLEDLFAYAEAEDVTVCIDGTEVQVRRPQAGLCRGTVVVTRGLSRPAISHEQGTVGVTGGANCLAPQRGRHSSCHPFPRARGVTSKRAGRVAHQRARI